LLPWTGLVPAAVWLGWRRREAGDRFLLTAALFVVLFFSISAEKRELYVLPAFPAFALLVARLLRGLGEQRQGRLPGPGPWWVPVGQGIVGGALGLAGLGLLILGRRIEDAPYWGTVSIGAIALLTGVATTLLAIRRKSPEAAVVPAIGFVCAYFVTAVWVYPAMQPRKSARPLAIRMAEESAVSRAAGHRVLAYDVGNLPEALALYSDGVYTVETGDPRVLARHLSSPDRVLAVVSEHGLDRLPERYERGIEVIARYELGRSVLLIANRPRP
jgi:4-amino-4-deoxy-L-arabinose transferase-like glycosyltransferase